MCNVHIGVYFIHTLSGRFANGRWGIDQSTASSAPRKNEGGSPCVFATLCWTSRIQTVVMTTLLRLGAADTAYHMAHQARSPTWRGTKTDRQRQRKMDRRPNEESNFRAGVFKVIVPPLMCRHLLICENPNCAKTAASTVLGVRTIHAL